MMSGATFNYYLETHYCGLLNDSHRINGQNLMALQFSIFLLGDYIITQI